MGHMQSTAATEHASTEELGRREQFCQLFKQAPIPDDELLSNLALFTRRQDLSRVLFMHDLYRRILDVHGTVMEFGVRWGQDLALFTSFRGIYEPFHHIRKIVGFDTFEGFPSVHEKDGGSDAARAGMLSVTAGYEEYLKRVLDYHEQESPISHKQKYELVKGDATVEVEKYFERNPETIVALAYFDFDIYEPTKKCLEVVKDHLTKGSVVGFDELNVPEWPGETVAVKEVFGLDKYRISRGPCSSVQSFIVIE